MSGFVDSVRYFLAVKLRVVDVVPFRNAGTGVMDTHKASYRCREQWGGGGGGGCYCF